MAFWQDLKGVAQECKKYQQHNGNMAKWHVAECFQKNDKGNRFWKRKKTLKNQHFIINVAYVAIISNRGKK